MKLCANYSSLTLKEKKEWRNQNLFWIVLNDTRHLIVMTRQEGWWRIAIAWLILVGSFCLYGRILTGVNSKAWVDRAGAMPRPPYNHRVLFPSKLTRSASKGRMREWQGRYNWLWIIEMHQQRGFRGARPLLCAAGYFGILSQIVFPIQTNPQREQGPHERMTRPL